MKGLSEIPTIADLESAYRRIQINDIGCAEIALWSQWVRFDPRLGEQLVSCVCINWPAIDAVLLNEEIKKQPWPACLGIIMEQAFAYGAFEFLKRDMFKNWICSVMSGVASASPIANEQFFIGLRALGGKAMFEDATRSLEVYRRWGYLGREIMVNKAAYRVKG
ncbi:MAG: hypothetical protein AABZ06_11985 [Bdellovibrionota bacterium]